MASVKARAAEVVQPRGGYMKLSDFEIIERNDGVILHETESVHPSVIGMVVDYLTRVSTGTPVQDAFSISLAGAEIAESHGMRGARQDAVLYAKKIKGVDDDSIVCACKLVTFDVWRRNVIDAMSAKTYREIIVDKPTIENIRTLVSRSTGFFSDYGPIIADGFDFAPETGSIDQYLGMISSGKGAFGGYTATVESGDGDFLTEDTLWDFKVLKSKPNKNHILQIIMYWIMGKHSGQKIFSKIKKVGIFNPRLNVVYVLDMNKVPQDVITAIERDVICY